MEKQAPEQRTSPPKGVTLPDKPAVEASDQKRSSKSPLHLIRKETTYVDSKSQSRTEETWYFLRDEDFESLSIKVLGLRRPSDSDSLQYCSTSNLQNTFYRLVRKYHKYLLSLAYQILENKFAAEDVVQESWAKAFTLLKQRCEHGEQVDISHLKGFLGVIVRNTVHNYLKREHRLHFIPLETSDGKILDELETIEGDKSEQPEFHLIQDESRTDLAALLQWLPIEYRTVLILRFYYDYSLEETAKLLGRPIGTVKCYQNRGLKKLRQAVQHRKILPEDLNVWSNYSQRDSWLWDHMARYKSV